MSLFQRIKASGVGTLAMKIARQPGIGGAVRGVAQGVKAAEHSVLRRLPKHRAHDRAQRKALAAFAAKTSRTPR